MTGQHVGVGVIGAGMISSYYLKNLVQFPDLKVVAIADLDLSRAVVAADAFGLRASTVDELLASDDIEIVLNLTIPAAHYDVSHQILNAGKHVWSEKPLTLTRDQAAALNAYAADLGLRVACAPDTFLGGALQTPQRAIADGQIGTVHSALGIVQSPGPERVHPNPAFFYTAGAGPVLDMGPYYVTAMVQMLGAVVSVVSVGAAPLPTRRIRVGDDAGTEFPVLIPTQNSALITFASGATATLVTSFDSGVRRDQLEFYGTSGTLQVPNPNHFEGDSTLTPVFEEPQVLPTRGSVWGRGVGVVDLARSIRAEKPERASGLLAEHVLDVLLAIQESTESGERVRIATTVDQPEPLPEEWDPTELTLNSTSHAARH